MFTSFDLFFVFPPSARVDLDPSSHSWYESLKNKIRHEQTKPVWVSEVTVQHSFSSHTHLYTKAIMRYYFIYRSMWCFGVVVFFS